jgi:large subunit ribosomal protein L2
MNIITYSPVTPSLRHKTTIISSFLSKNKPKKNLIKKIKKKYGRNNQGKITIRHKGGGHKKKYRIIDFKRNLHNIKGIVKKIEYDPNRNSNIALIQYENNITRYIIHPNNLELNDFIFSGPEVEIKIGNCLPLKKIPPGYKIHNIELTPRKGAQFIRAAGCFAKIIAKENQYVILRLSSKELRLFNKECYATIGEVGNTNYQNINLGKAGRNRWLGVRPTVRGSAMNPIDHPHGGGEGKCSIGKKHPKTPWGKPALGLKTRNIYKKSSAFIIHF